MPAAKEADRQPLDRVVLADDDPPEFLLQSGVRIAQIIDRLNVIVAQGVHDGPIAKENGARRPTPLRNRRTGPS